LPRSPEKDTPSNANTLLTPIDAPTPFFVASESLEDVRNVDNWENPSKIQKLEKFKISANKPEVLHIPKGYINGFKAIENNSTILIFSDYKLNEIADDNYRFDKNLWTNFLES